MRLKRWESPRREGRNDKGRGGSARKRQLKKQRQMLRQKLKEANQQDNKKNNQNGGDKPIFPIFFALPLSVVSSQLFFPDFSPQLSKPVLVQVR
ncbi:hypothetical protein [Anabaena azotica]|uniref:Uncharacterized protein n=1 Tax=Anabaena azotica FACHB-119 TaxID=947527 RepID=A0ABR8CX16_9NOST|nr:hypothetical protein [Anabaena azotica]MBD2499479.1 hypothetical protein [Anabaena azotica FACHB-119]